MTDAKVVCSRGFGKTWLIALIVWAICVLYPGTKVLIVSSTAKQATFVLAKLKALASQNANIANELKAGNARNLVNIQPDRSHCEWKNGSEADSSALDSCRGRRAKLVITDEALDVAQDDLEQIVQPTKLETRYTASTYGFQDFPSKTISITSACQKNNPFFESFMFTAKNMSKGMKNSFVCALDWKAALANGQGTLDFYLGEKARQPELMFDVEYGSKFVGADSNSAFPYELTESCRTLKRVETEQPKNAKSRYVISLDIATSEAKNADNSIISVLKFIERQDGSYARKLVLMRSFHGKGLDTLAEEIRKLYHRDFPNTEKIIYDARGLGDSLDRFFDKEWLDLKDGKEYPPLVTDDVPNPNSSALPVLHPFRAIQTLNQRIYTNLRVALEQKTIELPVNSRIIIDEADGTTSMQERAIFVEADALQYEMGNIVGKIGASGNILYDVPKQGMHKDRYSSLAMGNDYISEIEKGSIRQNRRGEVFVGMVSNF